MKSPLIGININVSYFESSECQTHYKDEYQIRISYVDCVYKAGGIPVLVPCFEDENMLRQYMQRVDGFLFIGGADYPPEFYNESLHQETKVLPKRRSSVDIMLVKLALSKQIPILGICAGIQLINIASGGKLIQHLPTVRDHGPREDGTDNEHETKITGGKILKDLFGTRQILVNSGHHQGVDPKFVGSRLQVVAQAENGVVEAIESVDERFLLGVQWHPERIRDIDHQKKIFDAFVKASAYKK